MVRRPIYLSNQQILPFDRLRQVCKDLFGQPPVSATHHMINRTIVFQAQLSTRSCLATWESVTLFLRMRQYAGLAPFPGLISRVFQLRPRGSKSRSKLARSGHKRSRFR